MVEDGLEKLRAVDARMRGLIEKRKIEELTDSEQNELEKLGDLYNLYPILRISALLELQERGYDTKNYLKDHAPNP